MNKPRGNPSKAGKTVTHLRLAALAKARAARTRHRNNPGVTAAALDALLREVAAMLRDKRKRGVVSLRIFAKKCGCDEKSLRLYLRGSVTPPAATVDVLRELVW